MGNSNNKLPIIMINKIRFEKIKLRKNMMSFKEYKSHSKGEKIIIKWIEAHNIPYRTEFKHPNLPDLRYDFLIYDKGRLWFIEFDGEQHFKNTKRFYKTDKDFWLSQQRDIIKTKLIEELKSRLIRIDFSKIKHIESHLEAALKQKNVIVYLSTPVKYEFINMSIVDSAVLSQYRCDTFNIC
ncbi:MAG: hypothetical protein ACYCPT_09125 [Acidimicrobiales bacterium]